MILVVDDKQENLLSLKSLLKNHSYPVDTAASGEEALKKILKNTYALIMLDVQMPGMDGFEVAETISSYSKTRDVPIIFLSAINTDKKYITRGFTSGAVDYIAKPIDPDILLLKVNTLYRLYEQKRMLNEMQVSLRSEIEFRKQAQVEAYEKALELKVILESIPQIAFTLDRSGEIDYRNSKWNKYTQSPGHWPTTHPEDPDIRASIDKTVASRGMLEMELRLRANGENHYRYHLLRMLPVRENEQIIRWVGTFTDIEEQKQAIRKKDEFISVASHELKTPLTTIQGYMQLLGRMIPEDDTVKLFIKRSLNQVRKLDGLITDLLDISKIENGRLQLNKTRFLFGDMIREVIEIVSQTFPNYQLVPTLRDDGMVVADKSRLEQVLLNFISNAFKYSPADRRAELLVNKCGDDRLYVSVKDSGIGIPESEQAFVFDKFYRTEISQETAQGLGIGLYICADILRRHGSDFGVKSEPGKGSEFYFTIPVSHNG
jgi:signal transduction histidine kinase/DNA-binding response OmpR family regulator